MSHEIYQILTYFHKKSQRKKKTNLEIKVAHVDIIHILQTQFLDRQNMRRFTKSLETNFNEVWAGLFYNIHWISCNAMALIVVEIWFVLVYVSLNVSYSTFLISSKSPIIIHIGGQGGTVFHNCLEHMYH